MTMHLKGFKQAVKKLAKGRYHAIQIEVIEYADGGRRYEYRAYIVDRGWTATHDAPEEALSELEKM